MHTMQALLTPEQLSSITGIAEVPVTFSLLSKEQQIAKDMILAWLKEPGKQEFRLVWAINKT